MKLYRLLQQDEYWAALAAIVDNLLAHETLEGEEVEDIVRQWLRSILSGSWVVYCGKTFCKLG